jgi:hypothetical protein
MQTAVFRLAEMLREPFYDTLLFEQHVDKLAGSLGWAVE